MMSGTLLAFSIVWIFVGPSCPHSFTPPLHHSQLPLFNYIIDVYTFFAASALSSSTVVRSIFGAVFPVRLIPTKLMTSNADRDVSVVCHPDVREART
jgi:hypothetical protein